MEKSKEEGLVPDSCQSFILINQVMSYFVFLGQGTMQPKSLPSSIVSTSFNFVYGQKCDVLLLQPTEVPLHKPQVLR